ncbi:MAG: pilus assembly protein TadB [Clostridia bacterium]|nr:pilus assembly protein TadB [Clostridia bacterium]
MKKYLFKKADSTKKTLREQNGLPENYDQYQMSKREKSKLFTISFITLFIAAYIFYQNILLSLIFSSLSFLSEHFFLPSYVRKRKKVLSEQFIDALYSLSSFICAGKQMPQAVSETYKSLQLLYSDDTYIVKEFGFMVKRLQEAGESIDVILLDFAQRTEIEDIMNFTNVYVTCRKTGGDMEAVMRRTSDMIIEKINIRQEIEGLIAQKKYEARILTMMPFIVILFILLMSPGYLDKMYHTLLGRLMMTGGLIAIGISYKWSEKITDIEV